MTFATFKFRVYDIYWDMTENGSSYDEDRLNEEYNCNDLIVELDFYCGGKNKCINHISKIDDDNLITKMLFDEIADITECTVESFEWERLDEDTDEKY